MKRSLKKQGWRKEKSGSWRVSKGWFLYLFDCFVILAVCLMFTGVLSNWLREEFLPESLWLAAYWPLAVAAAACPALAIFIALANLDELNEASDLQYFGRWLVLITTWAIVLWFDEHTTPRVSVELIGVLWVFLANGPLVLVYKSQEGLIREAKVEECQKRIAQIIKAT